MKIPKNCFECEEGQLVEIVQDYTDVGPDGASVVVPGVKMFRCTQCGEELIPAESNRYISRYVAEANEQLTKVELYAMLEASGLSQKDFAEAIGLGEKTFHRWLKGTQVVSRSMGYYLRALERFPAAFAWVRERGWRKPAPAVVRTAARDTTGLSPFFALARRSAAPGTRVDVGTRSNPARTLMLKAVHHQSPN
jgi:putative zinc finger/helix-turn-helix YgiT family protein